MTTSASPAPPRAGSVAGAGVRKAAASDLPAVADTLSAAFLDDPFMTWVMPDRQRRRELLPRCFEAVADANHPYDEIYTTASDAGVAVWIPPGPPPTDEEMEELVRWYAEVAEETADRLLCALELMAGQHPADPHAYLFVLGTRPEWQGRGLGSALLREVLDRCDRDGTPAYLEATSPDNQRLYERHGFVVTGEIPLPDGPALRPMWREPRPQPWRA